MIDRHQRLRTIFELTQFRQLLLPSSSSSKGLTTILFVLLLLVQVGWVRPSLPTREHLSNKLDQKLDYFIVQVNHENKVVASGETLSMIMGDHFSIVSAALKNPRLSIKDLNIVGFRRPDGQPNDRGIEVKTSQLERAWSENKQGQIYAVVATSPRILHGGIFLRIIQPVLRSLVVSINGKRMILRDLEPLRVKDTDLFKVESIETNLSSTNDIFYKVVAEGQRSILTLFRDEYVFAKIPIEVLE